MLGDHKDHNIYKYFSIFHILFSILKLVNILFAGEAGCTQHPMELEDDKGSSKDSWRYCESLSVKISKHQ